MDLPNIVVQCSSCFALGEGDTFSDAVLDIKHFRDCDAKDNSRVVDKYPSEDEEE